MPATSSISPLPIRSSRGSVTIEGQKVTIGHLEIVDSIVVEALSGASSPSERVAHLISLGALAHRAADADVVAHEFRHQMDTAITATERACERFAETVAAQSSRLFDGDENTLSVTDQITQTMEGTLTELLGEDASVGPLAELRKQVDDALAGHQRHLRTTLSLDSTDSPLAALQANVLHQLGEQNRALVEQVQTLSERLAVDMRNDRRAPKRALISSAQSKIGSSPLPVRSVTPSTRPVLKPATTTARRATMSSPSTEAWQPSLESWWSPRTEGSRRAP